MESNADGLPAVFHAQDRSGERPAETQIRAAGRRFEEAIGLGRCKQIDNRLDAQGDGLFERLLQFQNNLTDYFTTISNGTEGVFLDEQQFRPRCIGFAEKSQRVRAKKLNVMRIGILDGVAAAGKTRVFMQLQIFVIRVRARGIEEQNAEGVTGPAIVTKEALQARLFHPGLLVNGSDCAGGGFSCGFAQSRVVSLGLAQDGIDKRSRSGAEIERGDGAAVARLQEHLSFGRGKEQLICAVGVVVQEFDTWNERAGSLTVSDGLGANQVAPGIGAEMRGIYSAKYAVPIGVVALRAQKQIARLRQFIGGL